MIGGGRLPPILRLVAVALLAGIPFTQRPLPLAAADPPRYAAAVDDALDAAGTAEAGLVAAANALAAAIDAARAASANASTGEELDATRFEAAAAAAEAAAIPLASARLDLGRLAGPCAALGLTPPQLTLDPNRATAIGQEIAGAGDAASGFIGLRADTSLVLDSLAVAGASLAAGDHAAATEAADVAAAAIERVQPYATTLPALLLWLETSGDLLAAVRDAATALRDGDAAAAATARARLADAAAEAAVSDRALGLAISEGASRVLGSQLGQLAGLARDVADTRTALDSLRDALVARSGSPEAP